MKIRPFTKTNYPNGYSRKDALDRLNILHNSKDFLKGEMKRLNREIKEVMTQLKRGGIMEP